MPLMQGFVVRRPGGRTGGRQTLSAPEVALYVARCFGEGALVGAGSPRCCTSAPQGHALIPGHDGGGFASSAASYSTARTGWELAKCLSTHTAVDVPETLRHLIEQQFERLSPA